MPSPFASWLHGDVLCLAAQRCFHNYDNSSPSCCQRKTTSPNPRVRMRQRACHPPYRRASARLPRDKGLQPLVFASIHTSSVSRSALRTRNTVRQSRNGRAVRLRADFGPGVPQERTRVLLHGPRGRGMSGQGWWDRVTSGDHGLLARDKVFRGLAAESGTSERAGRRRRRARGVRRPSSGFGRRCGRVQTVAGCRRGSRTDGCVRPSRRWGTRGW